MSSGLIDISKNFEIYHGGKNLDLAVMELGDILGQYSRNNIRDIDLCWWEEGLANRIASDVSGVSLEDAQKVAPQDWGKLETAKRLRDAGYSGHALAESVQSYQALHELVMPLA